LSTRTCPHCKATILASAAVCPGCKGHLRFDKPRGAPAPKPQWRVEGSFMAERPNEAMEYCILVSVRDERNEEIARHVVNVGTLQGDAKRTFALIVETSDVDKQ
jgi:predicted amidophosphoribosyltransferase